MQLSGTGHGKGWAQMRSEVFRRSINCLVVAFVVVGVSACTPSNPGAVQPPNVPAPTPTSQVPSDWVGTNELVQSGVAQVKIANCAGGEGWGSGFLIGNDLIVTAAHVVADAAQITADVNGQSQPAEIIGIDRQQDYALIRTKEPVTGHVFSLYGAEPKIGEEVAAFGFPLTGAFQMNQGRISGLDASYPMVDESPTHMIQTDAAINHGNSGGPITLIDGSVVGIAILKPSSLNGVQADRIAYAVDTTVAGPKIAAWKDLKQPIAMVTCASSAPAPLPTLAPTTTSPGGFAITVNSNHPDAAAVMYRLDLHGRFINSSSYAEAFADFTSQEQQRMGGLAAWSAGQATSSWKSLTIEKVTGQGDSLTVLVSLRTNQSATDGNGQTCSDFSIKYGMKLVQGVWLIDSAGSVPANALPKAC